MKLLKYLLNPFEILYLAIAIATFNHTMWFSAFAFEGSIPANNGLDIIVWYGKGALVAIAIDAGMWVSGYALSKSKSWFNSLMLLVAFLVAAAASFIMQTGYIVIHTPAIEISKGVSEYWYSVLSPVVEARVFILPLALPLLALIYTFSRITKKNDTPEVMVERQVKVMKEELPSLGDDTLRALAVLEMSPEDIDLETNTIKDPVTGEKKVYKTSSYLTAAIRRRAAWVEKSNAKSK